VIKILKQITGRDIGITSKKVQRKKEIMDCRADICKVSEAFDWQPIFFLKDALRDYIGEQGHV
jgi:nucleoside-diphosphate-sugar epimerase